MLFQGDAWVDGSLDYRGDGRITPLSSYDAVKERPSFLGGQRSPPRSATYDVVLAGKNVKVFHFRSGFIFRVDDHKMFRDVMDTLVYHLSDGESDDSSKVLKIRGLLHKILRKMIFPGDSVLSFLPFDSALPWNHELPLFHQRRFDAYNGENELIAHYCKLNFLILSIWCLAEYFGTNFSRAVVKCRRGSKVLSLDDIVHTDAGSMTRREHEKNFAIQMVN